MKNNVHRLRANWGDANFRQFVSGNWHNFSIRAHAQNFLMESRPLQISAFVDYEIRAATQKLMFMTLTRMAMLIAGEKLQNNCFCNDKI
jgi:hypothetical protein